MDSDNLIEIARQIYSAPPGAPLSIQLDLDKDTSNITDPNEFLFKMLVEFFHEGIKLLHGEGPSNKVDLSKLTQNDLLKLKQYSRSYGYELFINIGGQSTQTTNASSSKLSEHFFRINSKGMTYMIYFDRYQSTVTCH